MKDNEIIKALEETAKKGDAPGGKHWQLWISTKQAKDILDFINRLQAENERLQGYNQNLQTANTALSNEILEIKSEAVKEFVKKFEYEIRDVGFTLGQMFEFQTALKTVIKEMEREENEKM